MIPNSYAGADYRAVLLNPDDATDRAVLDDLRADRFIESIDGWDKQMSTLARLRPPPGPELTGEQKYWAYYPWRRTVISVLGPSAYRRTRLDRNRNLITIDEQHRLASVKVGVVGLSVGHAIAHGLATQGVCGHLRLADFDEIELSNLNRLAATVFDIGVNKAKAAARRIAEIDPYLDVRIMTSGLTADTVDEFMDGLDIVVEECDSLDMKALVRESARRRRQPVLMATSDRGLVDVERFDLEPLRPIFHGLLGDIDTVTLAGLSNSEKIPYVVRILDAMHLSPRAAGSLVEVGHTLSTWPQLASDVALGATALTEAVRRIGLGEPLSSGRTRIDVSEALDGLKDPLTDDVDAPGPTHDQRATNGSVSNAAAAAERAPSSGNIQPWRLETITSLFPEQAGPLAQEQLRYLADHDDLTGLLNRRALLAHLDGRLVEGQPGPVSALFFDLDRFKVINDYFGHTAGDWFIRVLAERLRERAEGANLVARLGGDEFVVVPAAPMDARAAEALAYELRSMLNERVSINGEMLTRTASIGVAVGIPGRDTTSDLLSRADQAVLSAKSLGVNTVAVYSDDMSLKSELRNDIELHLQNGIESGGLFLHYLPEVDMRTGEVLATEALVRWQHPTRGLLSPASFITVAESINLAGELGRWVMRTACAEFAQWRSRGLGTDIVLRLNVSPVQLVPDGFVDSVASVMQEFDLKPGSVCLEITESVVVQDIEMASVTLASLKKAGVQLAIDDFGTGYSVFSHLKTLPVDVLKIDRGFVTDLGSSADDLAIVRAIIALAGALELQLVAEGVETEVAAKTLLSHGCHRAQGFLLSRPLSGTDMEALLSKGRVATHFPEHRATVGS